MQKKARIIVSEFGSFPYGQQAIEALHNSQPVAFCYGWSNLTGEDNILVVKATPVGEVENIEGDHSGKAAAVVAALEDSIAPGRVSRVEAFRLAKEQGLIPVNGHIDYVIED